MQVAQLVAPDFWDLSLESGAMWGVGKPYRYEWLVLRENFPLCKQSYSPQPQLMKCWCASFRMKRWQLRSSAKGEMKPT